MPRRKVSFTLFKSKNHRTLVRIYWQNSKSSHTESNNRYSCVQQRLAGYIKKTAWQTLSRCNVTSSSILKNKRHIIYGYWWEKQFLSFGSIPAIYSNAFKHTSTKSKVFTSEDPVDCPSLIPLCWLHLPSLSICISFCLKQCVHISYS